MIPSNVIVDGDGSGRPVMDFIEQEGLQVGMILLTHAHFDHMGALRFEAGIWMRVALGARTSFLCFRSPRSISLR